MFAGTGEPDRTADRVADDLTEVSFAQWVSVPGGAALVVAVRFDLNGRIADLYTADGRFVRVYGPPALELARKMDRIAIHPQVLDAGLRNAAEKDRVARQQAMAA